MRRKQEELINYLYTHNEKVTANILSKALNLSIRTIKSYIAELNMNYPSLISSSNRGYVIDKVKANSLLQYKDDIPQDYESRCIYIIKKTLLEKQDYICLLYTSFHHKSISLIFISIRPIMKSRNT